MQPFFYEWFDVWKSVVETHDKMFAVTPKGMLLKKDNIPSVRGCLLLEESYEHRSAWNNMEVVLKQGPSSVVIGGEKVGAIMAH